MLISGKEEVDPALVLLALVWETPFVPLKKRIHPETSPLFSVGRLECFAVSCWSGEKSKDWFH